MYLSAICMKCPYPKKWKHHSDEQFNYAFYSTTKHKDEKSLIQFQWKGIKIREIILIIIIVVLIWNNLNLIDIIFVVRTVHLVSSNSWLDHVFVKIVTNENGYPFILHVDVHMSNAMSFTMSTLFSTEIWLLST